MKVRLELKIHGSDGEKDLVRDIEMPAPPSSALHIAGRGWHVEVERVSFSADTGEYRARCVALRDPSKTIATFVRAFEIEEWRTVLPR